MPSRAVFGLTVMGRFAIVLGALGLGLGSCSESDGAVKPPHVAVTEGTCQNAAATAPDFLKGIGCRADFDVLASVPLDTSIPGARAVKVVLDQSDGDALYFQNSQKFQIHHQFVSTHLSGGTHPIVPPLSEFNQTEYFRPDRRFILAEVTYYEEPDTWALEIAPYDTASADMVAKLYAAIAKVAYFGPALVFHPTSEAVATTGSKLPKEVRVESSDDLYNEIDYQPLNLATAYGHLHFLKASQLEVEYVGPRDIVVLDHVPNDISVVTGMITQEFQTPLSHVNVLAQNRKTPNMGLRGAFANAMLKALDGKWVKLMVGATEWSISEVTAAEADADWQTHKPKPVVLPAVDLSVRDLPDIQDVVKTGTMPLRDAIKAGVAAFGGKAAHYSVMAQAPGIPVPPAFAIPAVYYVEFMQKNGLFDEVEKLMERDDFKNNPEARANLLTTFRSSIRTAPMDEDFQARLKVKLEPFKAANERVRFRTSTNSEDLDGFPCAGCYESHTGDPWVWSSVLDAIRKAYASAWLFRTFEERTFNGIDHRTVVMALLCHHNFPSEEANGVALTANPFDESGLQPGFYVNVQFGGESEVVHPPPGTLSDQFIYQFGQPNQPLSYISHSNIIQTGTTVLSVDQVHELGAALDLIHKTFSPAYGPQSGNNGWYAMDVEFKFDAPAGQVPKLAIKQARPHPGRGQ